MPILAFRAVTLDNVSTPWVVGWLPDHRVGGPGLFNVGWTVDQWEEFLFGTHEQRVALLGTLPANTLFLVTPFFLQHYGQSVTPFLRDPCFAIDSQIPVLTVTCAPS